MKSHEQKKERLLGDEEMGTKRLFKKNNLVLQKAIENELCGDFKSINEIANNLEISRQCVSKYVYKMWDLDLVEVTSAGIVTRNNKLYHEYKGNKYRLKKS